MLKQDLRKIYDRKQGNRFRKLISCYRMQGVHAIITFRFGQWLLKQNTFVKIILTPFYLFQNHRITSKWGISLDRTAKIEEGFYIGHYGGIFIAGNAKIGRNFNISQDVTIGVSGQGDKRGCPVIGNNVYIAPGAKLFGKINIGNNVKIGANAVVHKNVPDDSIVVLEYSMKIIPRKDLSVKETKR